MADTDRRVPIKWDPGDNLPSLYASNLTVQANEHEFTLSFYEMRPPLLVGTPEENAAKLQAVTELQTRCLARVVVSPGRMADFVRVIQEQFDRQQQLARAAQVASEGKGR